MTLAGVYFELAVIVMASVVVIPGLAVYAIRAHRRRQYAEPVRMIDLGPVPLPRVRACRSARITKH